MADYKRFVAKKLKAEDLPKGKFKEEDNSLIIGNNKEVKRIRLMATVIRKFISDDEKYGFLVLDDSTDTVRSKAFREDVRRIKRINKGDIVDLIGRVDKYEDEVYIRPEIVRKVKDPNWLLVRKLELLEHGKNGKSKKEAGKEPEKKQKGLSKKGEKREVERDTKEDEEEIEVAVEEVNSPEEIIYEFLSETDKAKFENMVNELDYEREKIKDVLKNLMQDGRVFEPKKKVYKAL